MSRSTEPTETPGAIAQCDRCGRKLRVAESRDPNSKLFRRAKVPKGLCPECVMTAFLYNAYPINMQIDEAGPELLLKGGVPGGAPFFVQALVASGVMDECEMDVAEIDWQLLVQNWDLPVKVPKSGLNPYRMGESPRAQRRRSGAPDFESPRAGFFTDPPTEADLKRRHERAVSDLKGILKSERERRPN